MYERDYQPREKILGTEIVDGIRVGHTLHEVEAIRNMIEKYKPDWFIEVGIHEGGLSYLLIPLLPIEIHYMGIEINCHIVQPIVERLYRTHLNTKLICGDCFDSSIVGLLSTINGKIMVYCDNGNKPKELIAYAPQLVNMGDIIMTHDYSDGQEVVGVSGYGEIEFPKPEVLPEDVSFLYEKFDRIEKESVLKGTRIIAFVKRE